MMNLITFFITIPSENQVPFAQSVEALRSRWSKEKISISLFRDGGRPERFLLMLLTERTIDDVTGMIRDADEAGHLFASMKSAEGSISVSYMEQVV
ncbi:hypothetical protein JXO52_17240 [bacterium]|nr:hypothetical protein [bacterium]